MVAPATTVYLLVAIALAGGFLLTTAVALRETGYTRKMVLVASIPAISMSVAYVLMSMEVATVETVGREQSVMRFFGYTFGLLSVAYLVSEAIDCTGPQFGKLAAALVLTPWLSFVSWLFTGPVESFLTLSSLLIFGYAGYLLFGPLNRVARAVGGQRQLFFAKLRNLFVLCYGTLVLMSALSEQVLGLTDTFVATLGAGYADAILMYGVALLVITSRDIFREKLDRGDVDEHSQTAAESPLDPAGTD